MDDARVLTTKRESDRRAADEVSVLLDEVRMRPVHLDACVPSMTRVVRRV
jgi:hypothetical protein